MRITLVVLGITFGLFIACSNGESQASENATVELTQEGAKAKYEQKCGLCHGADGKLMLAGAPNLTISDLSHEQRIAIITNGKGVMTPFENVLTPQEIEAIATYIASFVE